MGARGSLDSFLGSAYILQGMAASGPVVGRYYPHRRLGTLYTSSCSRISRLRLTIEQVAQLAYVSIDTWLLQLGLGQHVWDLKDFAQIGQLSKFGLIGSVLSICAVVWSKTAFAVMLLRITEGRLRMFVWFTIVSMNVLMGLSAVVLFIQCQPIAKSWDPTLPGTCWPSDVGIIFAIVSACKSTTRALLRAP
jgi:hypothetical protein